MSASSWTTAGAFIDAGGSTGKALAVSSTTATPITLTFDVASGFQVDISSFNFWRQTSASATWSMTINGIVVGSGTAPTSGTNTGNLVVSNTVNGLTGTIVVVLNLSGTGSFRIDDFTLSGFVTAVCSTPSSQTGFITASGISPTGLNAGFTRGADAGSILVLRPTAQIAATPVYPTNYTGANIDWASAQQINVNNRVMANSTAPASSVVAVNGITGLSPETQYSLTAYEKSSTNCYNLTNPPSLSFYTLSLEPGAHPAAFSVDGCTYNNFLKLDFTAASSISTTDGYVILRRQGATAPTTAGIEDGKDPASWTTLPLGTTVVTTISNTSSTTFTDNTVAAGTQYSYLLIPYNANSSAIAATYNYYTGASPKIATGTTSNAAATSTITSTFTYNSDIDYLAYHGNATPEGPITNTSNSVGVFGVTITDAGGDGKPTIVKSLTFGVNAVAQNTIARYALFNGNALIAGTDISNPTTNTVSFTGLTISVPESGPAVNITLRATFYQTSPAVNAINDHGRLAFSLASSDVTVDCGSASSQIAAFTTINSSTSLHHNHIGVTATKLVFSPVIDGSVNTNLNSFTISAADAINRIDTDINGAITISSSGSGISGHTGFSLTNGVVSVGTVQFNFAQGPITLSASGSGLSGVSNPFNISSVMAGTFRSIGGGVWSSTAGNNTAQWQVFSGGWQTLPYPAGGYNNSYPSTSLTTDVVYIYHDIVLNGTNTVKNIVVEAGGILSTNTVQPTLKNLLVKNGGRFNKESNGTKFDSDGTLEIEDGGTMTFIRTSSGTTHSTNLWAGTEKFHKNSNFIVLVTDNASGSGRLVTEDINSISNFNGAKFGNFIIDMQGNGAFPLLPGGMVNVKLTSGKLIFRRGVDNAPFVTAGDYSITIGDSIIIENTYNQAISLTNSTSLVSVIVNGSVLHNGTAEFRLASSQTSSDPGVVLNIDSNLVLSNTGQLNFDAGSS
ncbi:MAG: hypothetical protein EOP51_20780 [Sphingobacteriales bacterium]|nr:MAG: hypothetical protein EOP51_20780 [Sphingobacteriales bacterium]